MSNEQSRNGLEGVLQAMTRNNREGLSYACLSMPLSASIGQHRPAEINTRASRSASPADPKAQALRMAKAAAQYQESQAALGNYVTTAQAVRHVAELYSSPNGR